MIGPSSPATPIDSAAPRPALWLVSSLAALGPFSVSLYLPAVPALTVELGATPAQGQLTMTVYLAAFALAQLVYGPVSDRVGRRPTMLAGLVIYVLASAAAAVAPTIGMLLVARFVQALGVCAGTVLSRAVVRDSTSGAEIARTLAVIAAALTLSPALGPAVGGIVAVWFGWRACFVLLTGFGAVLLGFTICRMPETNRSRARGGMGVTRSGRGYAELLGDQLFVAFVFGAAFTSAGIYVYNIGAPFVFISILGFAPDEYGLLGLITGAGYFVGTMIVRHRASKVSAGRLALEGSAWALAGAIGLLIIAAVGPLTATSIITTMIVYAIGLGFLLPITSAGALARYPHAAGAAAAVIGCAQMGFGMASTAILSTWNPTTAMPMAEIIAASAVLALACCWFAVDREGRATPPGSAPSIAERA